VSVAAPSHGAKAYAPIGVYFRARCVLPRAVSHFRFLACLAVALALHASACSSVVVSVDAGPDAGPPDRTALDAPADVTLDAAPPDRPALDVPADVPVDRGDPDGAATRAVIEAYCDLYARGSCARDLACGWAAPPHNGCAERLRPSCVRSFYRNSTAVLLGNIAAGDVRIDMAAASACFGGPRWNCLQRNPAGEGPTCARIFVGTLRLGEACVFELNDIPCSDGYCPISGPCAEGFCPLRPTFCPARCTPFAALGDFCRSVRVDGYVCSPGATCEGGTCRALSGRGMPCAAGCVEGLVCRHRSETAEISCELPAADGEFCIHSRDCASGLCDRQLCRARAEAVGDYCERRTQCPTGLGCYSGPGALQTCQPDLSAGERCTGWVNHCGPGLVCEGEGGVGVCRAQGGEQGDPCTLSCHQGLVCNAGFCTLPVPLGGRCDRPGDYDVCAFPNHCDVDGVCRGARDLGGACQQGVENACVAGLFCGADGRCARLLPLDAACDRTAGRTCAAGLACLDGRCAPAPRRNAQCAWISECAEGLYCVRNVCTGTCPR